VLTPPDCATLKVSIDVYAKHHGESSFTYLASRTAIGAYSYTTKHCQLGFSSTGQYSFTPPATDWDTYRIAATHQVLGQYEKAQASFLRLHQ
jgi:hypothetical protein